MGVYGEISHFLSDPTEISFLTTQKMFTYILYQLQIGIISNTKVTAKNRLTNYYEMNSNSYFSLKSYGVTNGSNQLVKMIQDDSNEWSHQRGFCEVKKEFE